mmetsp:Transcript_6548/g.14484  ORF Transcript_6548/g.14484 Transcript_6548/m.14484 type:complete len:111 (-) Transcript_6548:1261-1593(-)
MKTQTMQLIRRLRQKEILQLAILGIVIIVQKPQRAKAARQIPAVSGVRFGMRAEDGAGPKFGGAEEDEGGDAGEGGVEKTEGGSGVTGCREELLGGVDYGVGSSEGGGGG